MERKEPMLAPRLGANIGSSFAGDWNQERRRKPSRYFIECFRSRPYRQCIGGSHTIYCTGSSTAMELIESTTNFLDYDQSVLSIITEEAAGYLAGDRSVEEASRLIQSRVNLYIQEQK